MNIVTVDDSEVILEYVSSVLESAGHTVIRAGNAAAALDAIIANSVDLVLSDVNMQGMDGFALARNLRGMERFAEMPIVFVTGDDSDDFKAKCRGAGANGWLKKPFKPDQMLGMIRAFEC